MGVLVYYYKKPGRKEAPNPIETILSKKFMA